MQSLSKLGLFVGALSISGAGIADVIEFEEFGLFANASVWSESVADMQVGDPINNFGTQGLGIGYVDNLDADNLGTVTWSIENTSGQAIDDFSIFSYLNADIDFDTNTFFNEHAEYVGNTTANSYEIDEPGYVFGDIYDNLLEGQLDGTNATPSSAPEDVSFALGFDLGRFEISEIIQVTVEISLADIGGIMHADADSDFAFFFNTSFTRTVASVSEPAQLGLLGLGLLGLFASRRSQKASV